MKNIKLRNIILNRIDEFNNYLINKFNKIRFLKNKLSKINHLKNKLNQISNFNKFLILFISTLFLYLFYVSTPSLYDYQRLQNQLRTHLLNEYNLYINISDKIQYKILPSPHFEVKDSIIYQNLESDDDKLGELKDLKIFISVKNIYNQNKIQLRNIEIKNSVFFLNKDNRKYFLNYFKDKKINKEIKIKKSKFFLMNGEEIISIFPINNFNFQYKEKTFTNEANINGIAFNSRFDLKIFKYFVGDNELNFDLKFPQINLSIKNKLLSQSKDKHKLFNTINFFGSEIKSELDINKNSLKYKSLKSKIFNTPLNFNGLIEFKPFYLVSNIVLDQLNLIKVLRNNDSFFQSFNKKNLVHKNFNSRISLDIKKFSSDNIFDRGKLNIEIQNGLIKFDNSKLISDKLGYLKIISSKIYNRNNKIIFDTQILINITNQKKFYNTFQVPKKYREDIKTINLEFETNLTVGETKISNFQINNIVSKNLTDQINKIIKENDIDINKNFNNWIVLKRFLNTIILEINQE